MKKCITFLALTLLMVTSISAQEEKPVFRQKGDLTLNVNGAMGIFDLYAMTARRAPYYMSAGGTAEYRITDGIALGLGAELAASEAYNTTNGIMNEGTYALSMPVFSSFKVNLWNSRRVSPFVEMRLGYAVPIKDKDESYRIWNEEGEIDQIDGSLKARGLYCGGGIGLSVYRSEVTLGVNLTQYEINGVDRTMTENGETIQESEYHFEGDPMANVYVRYTYKFGLNRNLPKLSVNTEHAGEMNLLVYGQIGLLDPLVYMDELIHSQQLTPCHFGVGTMLDYRLNRTLSLGLGVETYCSSGNWCYFMKASDRNAWLLPVYGNFRVRFGGRRVVPFGEVQLGYAFPLNTPILLPDWDGQVGTRDIEPSWHGPVQAKGMYGGVGFGLGFGHHEITVGHKCVPVGGNVTSIFTGETSYRTSNMTNIYMKYAYRIRLK